MDLGPEPLHLKTADHPEANGRQPQPGETRWTMDLLLEDGRRLFLGIGAEAHAAWREIFLQEKDDDLTEIKRLRGELLASDELTMHLRDSLLAHRLCPNGCGAMTDEGDGLDWHCAACGFSYHVRALIVGPIGDSDAA